MVDEGEATGIDHGIEPTPAAAASGHDVNIVALSPVAPAEKPRIILTESTSVLVNLALVKLKLFISVMVSMNVIQIVPRQEV